ncbi:MAG: isochorismatase family protein [SAR324 cluster bacterium]|nr:isochorismatase family protein [SAR324 cluster bacterium]MBL7034269.1 isochorismatase family protein [SAR324 cluster bacterium]
MSVETMLQDISESMPLSKTELDLSSNGQGYGLIIVDEVNGFATVGGGNLAPQAPNEQVSVMVSETNRLAGAFTKQEMPVLAFLDTHEPGKAEPPYPPHCELGTGEEELVPELKWLENEPRATMVRKDCINGFIGAYQPDGSNAVIDWVKENNLSNVLVVGICTDICVMDFVLTLLSARNHGMLTGLKEVLVYDKGCSTYDLPRSVVEDIGLPESASHPQEITHHMGLYFMASRGAQLLNSINL